MAPALAPGADPRPAARALASFAGREVLVVGDAIADLWVYGSPGRISREAPVLILEYRRHEVAPGGAGNCARNLAALGARSVLASPIGADRWGRALAARLAEAGVELLGGAKDGWRTPVKARFVAAPRSAPSQQVLRLDVLPDLASESAPHLAPAGDACGASADLIAAACAAARRSEAVVVSDYGLSPLAVEAWPRLRELAGSRPVVVNSRRRLLAYPQATVATPNAEELAGVWGRPLRDVEDVVRAGRSVLGEGGFACLVVTLGPEGMMVLQRGADPVHLPAADPAAVYDVTGAGDTVAAVLALGLAAGLGFLEAARLANAAASVAVRKAGTEPVTRQELEDVWCRG